MYAMVHQASAYETCDRTRMPLHMPKTLETCKKSTPCLIQKASKCAADCTSKTSVFYLSLSIKHKYLTRKSSVFIFYFIGENCMFLFSLHKERQTSKELKRNMNGGTIVFLTSLLIVLTWKILFFLFFFLIQDNLLF